MNAYCLVLKHPNHSVFAVYQQSTEGESDRTGRQNWQWPTKEEAFNHELFYLSLVIILGLFYLSLIKTVAIGKHAF